MKKPPVVEEIIVPFQYSPKVTLHPGDEFRCSGGPYWIGANNKKYGMGQKGLFKFVNSGKDGITATKVSTGSRVFIYMGETKIMESTGTHVTAHKIRKCRKKKDG